MLLGSGVQFNGIRVGEVTALGLNPDDPRQVMVTISVKKDTPVRVDTEVGLVFGGLTGVPEIALTGGTPGAPLPQASDGGPPLLVASAGTNVDWTAAAREAFASINALLSGNSENLTDTISNLKTFSEALSRNSASFDDIIAGLARLAGAGTANRAAIIYELTPASTFPGLGTLPKAQLVVNAPVMAGADDTQQFKMAAAGGDEIAFKEASWDDTASKVIQTAIIRSFENAGFLDVGRDFQGLAPGQALIVEVDTFHVVGGSAPEAVVAYTAKLVGSDGTIAAAKRFEAHAPLAAMDAQSAAAALGSAFAETASAMVPWTLDALAKATAG